MELYIFENYKEIFPRIKGRDLTDKLIIEALKAYEEAGNINKVSAPWQIERTDKGKPYILCGSSASDKSVSEKGKSDGDLNLHISVSHSGSLFVCLIGESPLGIDIQLERRINAEKICRRYFTPEEIRYADDNGSAGFFELWTRKEAYSKYTGKGLQEIMSGVSVMGREDVEFFDFRIEEGMYCSCCVKKNKDDSQYKNNIRITKGEEHFEL